MAEHRTLDVPSAWVCRFAQLIRAGGRALDLACGGGRHSIYLAGLNLQVDAVDRDADALSRLAGAGGVTTLNYDLENAPWPYAEQRFDAIVVTNYLHRPLFPHLVDALEPGGVFIYETFAVGNERYGRPTNPEFLLKPGELLEVARGPLRVIAYEDLYVAEPKAAMVQRICSVKQPAER